MKGRSDQPLAPPISRRPHPHQTLHAYIDELVDGEWRRRRVHRRTFRTGIGGHMRILDEDRDQAIERVTVFLTRSEAGEMRDMLNALLSGDVDQHVHVSDSDFRREVTLAIYSEDDLSHFSERARRIIETGE